MKYTFSRSGVPKDRGYDSDGLRDSPPECRSLLRLSVTILAECPIESITYTDIGGTEKGEAQEIDAVP